MPVVLDVYTTEPLELVPLFQVSRGLDRSNVVELLTLLKLYTREVDETLVATRTEFVVFWTLSFAVT